MTGRLSIEVVFATPERQALVPLEVSAGSTVGEAIRQANLRERFPGIDFEQLQAGIWGKPVDRERPVADGDRVELYRPLQQDPRDARRQLAADQRFGSSS